MFSYLLFLLSHTCTAEITCIPILGVAVRFHASWNKICNQNKHFNIFFVLLLIRANGSQAAVVK
jgi:hypothetical protein